MTAYVIVNYEITDPDLYQEYLADVGPILKIGDTGTALVVDSESEALEGSPGPQTVVLRYDSIEAAKEVWESGVYRDIVGKRLGASSNHFAVLVKGL